MQPESWITFFLILVSEVLIDKYLQLEQLKQVAVILSELSASDKWWVETEKKVGQQTLLSFGYICRLTLKYKYLKKEDSLQL